MHAYTSRLIQIQSTWGQNQIQIESCLQQHYPFSFLHSILWTLPPIPYTSNPTTLWRTIAPGGPFRRAPFAAGTMTTPSRRSQVTYSSSVPPRSSPWPIMISPESPPFIGASLFFLLAVSFRLVTLSASGSLFATSIVLWNGPMRCLRFQYFFEKKNRKALFCIWTKS